MRNFEMLRGIFVSKAGCIYIYIIYLDPIWPLFLKVNSHKTRPFPINIRVIWVQGIYIYIYSIWPPFTATATVWGGYFYRMFYDYNVVDGQDPQPAVNLYQESSFLVLEKVCCTSCIYPPPTGCWLVNTIPSWGPGGRGPQPTRQ